MSTPWHPLFNFKDNRNSGTHKMAGLKVSIILRFYSWMELAKTHTMSTGDNLHQKMISQE